MKKITYCLLLIGLCLGLTGCGGDEGIKGTWEGTGEVEGVTLKIDEKTIDFGTGDAVDYKYDADKEKLTLYEDGKSQGSATIKLEGDTLTIELGNLKAEYKRK